MRKKIICTLSLLFLIVSSVFAGSYTDNLSLYKPAYQETGWYTSFVNNYDVLDAHLEGWINSNKYASINAAVTAIGSTVTTLKVTEAEALTANLTIPSTLKLDIEKGGSIVKASTYTLSINGDFKAGLYQVFSGFDAGDVTGLKETYSQWWGAVADDETDDNTAFQSASSSLMSGGKIKVTNGIFLVSHFTVGDNITLEGDGWGSVLKCTRATGSNYYGIITNTDQVNGNDGIVIKNLKIWRTVEVDPATFDEHIYLKYCNDALIEHVWFLGTITRTAAEGHSGKGFNGHGCKRLKIKECIFQNIPDNSCGNHYQGTTTEGYDEYLNNSFLYEPTTTGTTHAHSFIIPNMHYVIIKGNQFYADSSKTAGISAIESGAIHNGVSWEIHKNVIVEGNHCVNAGIMLRAHQDSFVTSNTVTNGSIATMIDLGINSNHLVYFNNIVRDNRITFSNVDGFVISNNIIEGITGVNAQAIYGEYSSDISIIGNRIYNTGKSGIEVSTITGNLLISDNNIRDVGKNGGATEDTAGIRVDDTKNPVITNNTIFDSQVIPTMGCGISLYYAFGTILTNNNIRSKKIDVTPVHLIVAGTVNYAQKSGNTYNLIPVEGGMTFANAVPSSGTWHQGDTIFHKDGASGEPAGWITNTAGTFTAAIDNTGDTDGSTNVITGMTDTSDFYVGEYVSVSAGFATTGPYIILEKTSTTITINANSNSAQSNVTVATPDPVFKAMANLAV